MHINFTIDLISHVSYSCFVWKVWIHFFTLWILNHGLIAGINLTKYYLITNIPIFIISYSWNILSINFDHIVLMLINTISDHILKKPIEWLNLLIDYSILIEVRIDNFPLIIYRNLIISIIFNFCLLINISLCLIFHLDLIIWN
jgi:hypothetical protein